jgi:hypothetical protein
MVYYCCGVCVFVDVFSPLNHFVSCYLVLQLVRLASLPTTSQASARHRKCRQRCWCATLKHRQTTVKTPAIAVRYKVPRVERWACVLQQQQRRCRTTIRITTTGQQRRQRYWFAARPMYSHKVVRQSMTRARCPTTTPVSVLKSKTSWFAKLSNGNC